MKRLRKMFRKLIYRFFRLFPHKTAAESADILLVSYPKSGRTWLRLMIGKAFALHFKLQDVDLLEIQNMRKRNAQIPWILVNHGGKPDDKTPDELFIDANIFRNKKVILLVRDIKDLVVSYYFELTLRIPVLQDRPNARYEGDMASFLRSERGSVSTMIAFYNMWAENRGILADLLVIRYEDMNRAPREVLRRVLDFVGLAQIPDEAIAESVEFASFDNMRKMESEDVFKSSRLRAANPDEPESFKTRRGVVGGYTDYLTQDDIQYLNDRINTELSDFYGYRDNG